MTDDEIRKLVRAGLSDRRLPRLRSGRSRCSLGSPLKLWSLGVL